MEVRVDDNNFEAEVINSQIPVLVDFWAEWCMPCLMVAPALEEIAREYEGRLKVCKLNVDEAPQVSARFGIMSIPTMMIFKDGKAVDKTKGAMPKEEIENFIRPHIGDLIVE